MQLVGGYLDRRSTGGLPIGGVVLEPCSLARALTREDTYDAEIRELAREGRSISDAMREMVRTDAALACDKMQERFERSLGAAGLVSTAPYTSPDASDDELLWAVTDLLFCVGRPNMLALLSLAESGPATVERVVRRGLSLHVSDVSSMRELRIVLECITTGLEGLAAAEPIEGDEAPLAGLSFVVGIHRRAGIAEPTGGVTSLAAIGAEASKGLRHRQRWRQLAEMGASRPKLVLDESGAVGVDGSGPVVFTSVDHTADASSRTQRIPAVYGAQSLVSRLDAPAGTRTDLPGAHRPEGKELRRREIRNARATAHEVVAHRLGAEAGCPQRPDRVAVAGRAGVRAGDIDV